MKVLNHKGFDVRNLGDGKSPLRKKFNSIVKDLEENEHTDLGNIKLIKGDGDIKYLRAKLIDGDRLLFTSIEYNNESAFVILEVILNHRYDKSKFLTNRETIKNIEIIDQNNEEISVNESTVKIVDTPQVRWLGKFITFSAEQEEIVENTEGRYNLPLVVSGSAGSGKTSVALEKLRKIEKEGKILYITQSESLIKKSKELYEYAYYDEVAKEEKTGVPEQIEFLSVHEFLKKVIKEDEKIKGKKPINRSKFFLWFNEICKKGDFKNHKKDGDKIFEEFTSVIAGRCLGEKEKYEQLGNRQAIFSQEERGNIYNLFGEYKKFIEEDQKYYDPNLIAHRCTEEEIQANKVYDAVVIDEVQDLTEGTLDLILKSLKDENKNNSLLCGDVNQVIHPSFFSVSRLKSFFHERGKTGHKEPSVCILKKNYRNSKQVIELANRILHLKNYLFASEDTMKMIAVEDFFMKSDTKNTGNVGLIVSGAEQEIAEKMSRSTNFAVLVLDDESKKEAQRLFDTPLVFSIQEAKGLEFENVVLYKFMSHEAYNEIWDTKVRSDKGKERIENAINGIRSSYDEGNVNPSKPKDKEDKSFEKYKFYMNALYVGVTRAIDNVYIIEDKKQCNLLGVIEPKEKSNVDIGDIKKEESTLEEWRDMALKLIDEGKIEQAKDIAIELIKRKKQDYVKEIINKLNDEKYDEDAKEIGNKLQSSLDGSKPEQAMKSFSELKIDTENPSSRSPQKRLGGDIKPKVPAKKAKANQKCKGGKRKAEQNPNNDQEKKPRKLENDKKLRDMIGSGQLDKLKKIGISQYDKGEDVLDYALQCSQFKIVKYLVEQESNIYNQEKFFGVVLNHICDKAKEGDPSIENCLNACKQIIELIINMGYDVSNYRDPSGNTALHVISSVGFTLCNKGKRTYGVNRSYAVVPVLELLVKKIGEKGINTQNEHGKSPLHIAISCSSTPCAELLLKSGADVNAKDNKGNTPLHKVRCDGPAGVGVLDLVKIMVDKGADVNTKNGEGLTPCTLALRNGYSEIIDLLLANPDINVSCVNSNIKADYVERKENKEKILQKLGQDNKLFNYVKKAAGEKDRSKLNELLEGIKELLKPESKYDFKPSLNYSPDGSYENTTLKIAIKAGGEVLQLLYNYAKDNISVNTEILKQLEYAKEQQENSQPNSDVSNVFVSGNLTQDFKRIRSAEWFKKQ